MYRRIHFVAQLPLIVRHYISTVPLNCFTATSLIKKLNTVSEGEAVYESLRRSNIKPNLHVFSSLIALYKRCNEAQRSLKIVEDVICSDVTEKWLLVFLARTCLQHNEKTNAMRLWEKMVKIEIVDRIMLRDLITDFVANGMIENAKYILDMVVRNTNNATILDSLALYFLAQENIYNCLLIVEVLKKRQISPSNKLYEKLLFEYCMRQEFGKVQTLYEEMTEKGITFHAKLGTILIKVFCKSEAFDKAMSVIDRLEKDCIEMNPIVYTVGIKQLVTAKRYKQAQNLCDKLMNSNVKIDVELWNTIVNMYCTFGDINRAIQSITDMKIRGVVPDNITYTIIISGCIKTNNHSEAKVFYERLIAEKFKPNIELWNTIIKMYCRIGDIDSAMQTITDMKKVGHMCDNFTYNIIISGCIKAGRYEQARQFCEQLIAEHTSISVELWSTMIKLYCTIGEIDTAMQIILVMKRAGHALDKVIYNTIISGCISAAKYDQAQLLYNDLITKGVKMDGPLYNTIVKMYCTIGEVDKALQIIEVMKACGISLDCLTYTLIISGCTSASKFKQAMQLCEELDAVKIDLKLWNTIVSLYSSLCDMDKAVQTVIDMKKNGVVPNSITYNILISGWIKAGKYEEAQELYNELITKGIRMDGPLYNAIVKLFFTIGNFEKALQVVTDMKTSEFDLNNITYTIIINGCIDAAKYEQAQQFCDEMITNGIEMDVELWSVMIKLYCAIGDIDKAMQKIQDMKKTGHKPNSITYTVAINGCCAVGKYKQAEQLFNQMQTDGIRPDVQAYNSIINVHALKGSIEEAIAVHDLMQSRGCSTDVITYTTLLLGCDSISHKQYFKEIVNRMESSNIIKTTWLYSILIGKYFELGESENAIKTFKEMEINGIEPNLFTYRTLLSDASCIETMEEVEASIRNKKHRSPLDLCVLIMCHGQRADFGLALQEFHSVAVKDLDLWNTILNVCAKNGCGRIAIELLDEMIQSDTIPDAMSYNMVLSACSHSGLVLDAERVFNLARGIEKEHLIVSMIDVYARSNMLDKAEELAHMVKKDPRIAWITVLAGCKKFNDYERMSRIRAQHAFLADDPASMILIANICAQSGNFNERDSIRTIVDEKELKKIPGISYVKLKSGKTMRFTVEDKRVSQQAKDMIDSLSAVFGTLYGYVPDVSCVLKHFETHEEKVIHLHRHSEKLALGTALLEPGDHEIIITKNLRMCADCHSFSKMASEYTKRKLKIRDASRYHVFQHGKCSCHDFY